MSEKTYEMMWDCEYCSTPKLLGVTHRHCPECGAPQNPEKRYFPPEDQKVAVQDHKFVGADLNCPACGHAQSAAAKCCANCGSPLGDGKAVARQADQVFGADGQRVPPPGQQPEKKGGGGKIFAIIGVLILGVVGFFVVRAFWTKAAGVEVSGHRWERQIEIERYDEFEESGACKDVPSGADIVKRSKPEKVCKTRKIDQGDGTFKEKEECSKPVEQCTYKVLKWGVARTEKEKGDIDDEPTWPKVKLKQTGKCKGCEREGDKRELYIVEFVNTDNKDELSCTFSKEKEWKSYEVGDRYAAEVRVMGGGLDCDSLKPAN